MPSWCHLAPILEGRPLIKSCFDGVMSWTWSCFTLHSCHLLQLHGHPAVLPRFLTTMVTVDTPPLGSSPEDAGTFSLWLQYCRDCWLLHRPRNLKNLPDRPYPWFLLPKRYKKLGMGLRLPSSVMDIIILSVQLMGNPTLALKTFLLA